MPAGTSSCTAHDCKPASRGRGKAPPTSVRRCAAYLSQISIYTSDSRKTCLPYQHAVTGAVARADDYTLAAPVRNLRGEDCVAVIDMKNRLELACLPLRAVRCHAGLPPDFLPAE